MAAGLAPGFSWASWLRRLASWLSNWASRPSTPLPPGWLSWAIAALASANEAPV
jgi:hypothetical protein